VEPGKIKLAPEFGSVVDIPHLLRIQPYVLESRVERRMGVGHNDRAADRRTRDVSTRGLYFVIDQNVEAGSELDITLTLPTEVTRGSEVSVRALGRVMRVERRIEDHTPRMGVAAMIERYDIIRTEAARV